MSLLLGPAFAALGLLALAAIIGSLKQSARLVAELRSARREPLPVEELRLTMHDAVLPESAPIPATLRAPHQPRPIARLLQTSENLAEVA